MSRLPGDLRSRRPGARESRGRGRIALHDLTYFRSNFERIAERLATRGGAINLEGFRDLDQKRRSAISQAEQLKARKNQESVEIGKLRREGADTTERQKEVRLLAEQIAALDEEVQAVDQQFQEDRKSTRLNSSHLG